VLRCHLANTNEEWFRLLLDYFGPCLHNSDYCKCNAACWRAKERSTESMIQEHERKTFTSLLVSKGKRRRLISMHSLGNSITHHRTGCYPSVSCLYATCDTNDFTKITNSASYHYKQIVLTISDTTVLLILTCQFLHSNPSYGSSPKVNIWKFLHKDFIQVPFDASPLPSKSYLC